jgi:hypothetical protein
MGGDGSLTNLAMLEASIKPLFDSLDEVRIAIAYSDLLELQVVYMRDAIGWGERDLRMYRGIAIGNDAESLEDAESKLVEFFDVDISCVILLDRSGVVALWRRGNDEFVVVIRRPCETPVG